MRSRGKSPDVLERREKREGLRELLVLSCNALYTRALHYATDYYEGMERKSFAAMDCSVAQCLEVVGEWWSMLIIRDSFMGVTRFEDYQRRLGISRNILRDRLSSLVDSGVLVRTPYSEHPPRDDYKLTSKGLDLWPILTAMRQWGDKYAAPAGPPIELVHEQCGKTTHVETVCVECGERVGPRDVTAVVGAGRDPAMLLSRA